MKKLRIIFVGTGTFGAPILEGLLTSPEIEVLSVITGPDQKSGRGLTSHTSAIKELAVLNKLIIHQPSKTMELKQKIIQEKPDILLVVAYGEIIPEEFLKIPRLGAINIHGSLLPRYRGASPIQESLLHGDETTGITWILMNKKMDLGPVIQQETLKISAEDDYPRLAHKLSLLAAQCTPSVLLHYNSNPKASSQKEDEATYCRKINKQDGFLDLQHETAQSIIAKIKAYTPWPGCSILWNKKRLKIVQADIIEQKMYPGEVKNVENRILALGTQKGAIALKQIQPESKKIMGAEEFLRGQRNIPEKI
ncbi:MAG: methionyl-tRNA formyltransferase [Patescibacteria group bacterium]